MEPNDGSPSSAHQLGDVANGHVLTAAGWLPLRQIPLGSPGPYYAGDFLNGHAYTGSEWVPATTAAPPNTPAPHHSVAVNPQSNQTRSRWLIGIGVGLGVLFILGVVGGALESSDKSDDDKPTSFVPITVGPNSSSKPSPAAKPTKSPEEKYDARMAKKGWFALGTDGLWGKWAGTTSDSFSAGVRLRVSSFDGCPNGVYVEANLVDDSGTIISYTNDALPNLPPKQEAVLELLSTVDVEASVDVTEASCR